MASGKTTGHSFDSAITAKTFARCEDHSLYRPPVGTPNIDIDAIGDIVKKKGCQAVIVGNSA